MPQTSAGFYIFGLGPPPRETDINMLLPETVMRYAPAPRPASLPVSPFVLGSLRVALTIALFLILLAGCSSPVEKFQPEDQATGACQPLAAQRCPEGEYALDEKTCECRYIGKQMDFLPSVSESYFYPCEQGPGASGLIPGINTVAWPGESTLHVAAIAMVNCGRGVHRTGYRMDGMNISLWYEVSEIGEQLVSCVCGHELDYYIVGIEQREYTITLSEESSQ